MLCVRHVIKQESNSVLPHDVCALLNLETLAVEWSEYVLGNMQVVIVIKGPMCRILGQKWLHYS